MGLLRMLKYVLGTEDETQQPRQTQSSAKNANNAKSARTGQTKQTGQVARRVTQPQLQPHATPQRQSQRRQSQRRQSQQHQSQRPAKLTPQPLLPADRIDKARGIIGNIEKHELSDEQISAIAGAGHNTLVLAGAGTGKTTTIVGYIAWLLATKRATPEEILVLSFTKASADEMSQRIMQAPAKGSAHARSTVSVWKSAVRPPSPTVPSSTAIRRTPWYETRLTGCSHRTSPTVCSHSSSCRRSCSASMAPPRNVRISNCRR